MHSRLVTGILLSMLLIITATSCVSARPANGFRFTTSLFGGNANKPIVNAMTDDGISLHLLFDTGGAQATLFKSGLTKVIEKSNSKVDYTSDYTIDVGLLALDGQPVGKMSFQYVGKPTGYDEGGIDGIIGIGSIFSCNRILIDYRSNTIQLDGPKLTSTPIRYSRPEDLKHLFLVDIERDGHPEKAIIDTGNNVFTVSAQAALEADSLNRDSTSIFLVDERIELTEPKDILVKEIRIGELTVKNLHAYLATDRRLKTSELARRILSRYTSIGYSVLREHRIQFDFENETIAID